MEMSYKKDLEKYFKEELGKIIADNILIYKSSGKLRKGMSSMHIMLPQIEGGFKAYAYEI